MTQSRDKEFYKSLLRYDYNEFSRLKIHIYSPDERFCGPNTNDFLSCLRGYYTWNNNFLNKWYRIDRPNIINMSLNFPLISDTCCSAAETQRLIIVIMSYKSFGVLPSSNLFSKQSFPFKGKQVEQNAIFVPNV